MFLPQVLPCLHRLYPETFFSSSDIFCLSYLDSPRFRSENQDSAGSLLVGFFKYYSSETLFNTRRFQSLRIIKRIFNLILSDAPYKELNACFIIIFNIYLKQWGRNRFFYLKRDKFPLLSLLLISASHFSLQNHNWKISIFNIFCLDIGFKG